MCVHIYTPVEGDIFEGLNIHYGNLVSKRRISAWNI